MKFLVIYVCLFSVNIVAGLSSEEITEVAERCCREGEELATRSAAAGACAAAPLPADTEPEQRSACLVALRSCCEQQFKIKVECTEGIKLAPKKLCSTPKSEVAKTCCEECNIGKWIGESQGKDGCGAPAEDGMSAISIVRKNAYYQCCIEAAETPEPTTTPATTTTPTTTTEKKVETTTQKIEKCKKDSCEQICRDDDGQVTCSCKKGYRLKADKKTCKDINECAEILDDLCLEDGTVCHNTPGSFRCVPVKKREIAGLTCPPGYKRNTVNFVCDDINECQLPRPPCPKYLCENTVGGYKCSGRAGTPATEAPVGAPTEPSAPTSPRNDICPPGFRAGDNDECLDIDECTENLDDCQRLSQHCINTNGNFFCQDHVSKRCAPGFKVNAATGICEDINECDDDVLEVCRRNEICVNLPGAYNCKSKISTLPKLSSKNCQEGTRRRPGSSTCEDIDECKEGTHLCDNFQNCINTFGGHECRCKNGFELDSSSGSCVDVDECALKLDNCKPDTHCLNVLGSFTCTRHSPASSTTTLGPYEYTYYDTEDEGDYSDTSNVKPPPPPPPPATTSSTTERTTSTTTRSTRRPYPSFPTPATPTERPNTRPPYKPQTTTETTTTSRRPHYIPARPEYPRRPEYPSRPSYPNWPEYPRRPDYTEPSRPERPTRIEPSQPEPKPEPPRREFRPEYPNNLEPNRPSGSRPETPTRPEARPSRIEPSRPEYPSRPESNRPIYTRPEYSTTSTTQTTSRSKPTEVESTAPKTTTPVPILAPEPGVVPKEESTNVIEDEKPDENIHCLNGYEKSVRGECEDIDECATGHHICSNLEVCQNRPGGYICDCLRGFQRDRSGWCVPVPTSTATTPRTSTTPITPRTTTARTTTSTERTTTSTTPAPRTNNGSSRDWTYMPPRTPGSTYSPSVTCDIGFTYDTSLRRCVDVDECASNKNTCSADEDCVNLEGGYRCTCGARCRPDTSVDAISYVPPSRSRPNDDNVITVGAQYGERGPRYVRPSYSRLPGSGAVLTSCPWGYKLTDDKRCLDVDECARNASSCGAGQRCENFYGGYSCQCPDGHRLLGQDRCQDIDECAYGTPCPYNSRCVNTAGSYRCACGEGFRNAPSNERVCVDVDECGEVPSPCDQACANSWGGYRCYCRRGYRLHADNRTCVDIDECGEWAAARHRGRLCGGECVNEPGSYRCSCPAGYKLSADQRSCIDIDECESGAAQCAGAGAVCQNTRGGYHCHHIRCPAGYALESKHRCGRVQRSCPAADWRCLQQPSSYSYNFITFVANIFLPSGSVDLFTMHGPSWSESVVTFDMKMIDVQADPGVRPADLSCFEMRPTGNICVVSLTCSLGGPQVAELELSMSLSSRGHFAGSAVARLVVIVSQYEY